LEYRLPVKWMASMNRVTASRWGIEGGGGARDFLSPEFTL